MQQQTLNMAKKFYAFFEILPDEVQQLFLHDILKNHSDKLTYLSDCSTSQRSDIVNNSVNDEDLTENRNRTEDQQKRAIEIYDAYRDDLRKRQLSNTENYDKTILSLSSAGLALSLTAIRFAVPLATANYLSLIQWSWWLFGTTIFISIIAYFVSNKALDRQLEIADEYYSKGIEEAFSRKNWYSLINNWLNIAAGMTFLLATALIISFVTFNINLRESEMTHKSDKVALDSAIVPKMQQVTESVSVKGSATVPTMQFAPGKHSIPQQTKQGTRGNNGAKEP